MKCEKCGKDYPSKYYFKIDSICEACYNKMSPDEKFVSGLINHAPTNLRA
jgi:hypothetical protein